MTETVLWIEKEGVSSPPVEVYLQNELVVLCIDLDG